MYFSLWYLLYQGMYTLQILHMASLVGQDQEEIIAMGIQLTYMATNTENIRDCHKI